MPLPLLVLAILYIIASLVFVFFAYFNIYHIVRFGFLSWPNVLVMSIFIIGSLVIMGATWYAILWAGQHPLLPSGDLPATF